MLFREWFWMGEFNNNCKIGLELLSSITHYISTSSPIPKIYSWASFKPKHHTTNQIPWLPLPSVLFLRSTTLTLLHLALVNPVIARKLGVYESSTLRAYLSMERGITPSSIITTQVSHFHQLSMIQFDISESMLWSRRNGELSNQHSQSWRWPEQCQYLLP